MVNTLNPKNNIIENSTYSTPFNVDFFGVKPENFFAKCIERVLSLPESVKNILTNYSTAEFIEEKLGQTFGLEAEQKANLTRILRNILLADIFWGDFSSLISSKLRVDTNTANQIVKMLTDELLAPAKEDIKAIQKEKFKDRINQSTSSQVQQSPINSDAGQGNIINLRNRDNQ